jgi:hypothetical protein
MQALGDRSAVSEIPAAAGVEVQRMAPDGNESGERDLTVFRDADWQAGDLRHVRKQKSWKCVFAVQRATGVTVPQGPR